MSWSEFCDLLGGLSPKSALMRVVSIRSEEDPETLKNFTPEQRKMRSEWQQRIAKRRSPQEVGDFLAQMQSVFANMAGGESK